MGTTAPLAYLPPSKEQNMRALTVGDVIAIEVDGVSLPPVGIIRELSDESIRLSLYAWLTGTFTVRDIQVRRRDIRATMWAEPFGPDDDDLPHTVKRAWPDEVIWDMQPLADFQDGRTG